MNPTSAWRALVRTGFRLLYEEMSWSYDAVSHAVSLGHWAAWRRAALPFLRGPRVLELGFGPGHLQLELAAAGYAPTGLDASAQMARTAVRRLRAAGHAPGVVRGRAESLPFPATVFESVVATFPTAYIAAPETLAEVRRVLVPGGRLVIVPEAQLAGSGPLRRLIDAAYRATGQRPAAPDTAVSGWSHLLSGRLTVAGFHAVAHHAVALPGGRVLVVSGERPSGEQPSCVRPSGERA
jgi:ubiquinone/menaquinone biosynthesis C-methylase UbiE